MRKLKISVGIPAYNEESNIKNLIISILNQNNKYFILNEIIIISDASTDATEKKIKEINDIRIKLIKGKNRLGQNIRQNQIIKSLSKDSKALLLIEADNLPKERDFIDMLVSAIPKNGKYSLISANNEPLKPTSSFGEIIKYGFELKHEIFEKAIKWPNLYLFSHALFSREFFQNFTWDNNYHEDSYAFRNALLSNLPIIRKKEALLLFRPVANFEDYLLQSGKYLKAKKKENNMSNIYSLKFDFRKVVLIIGKYFVINPLFFTSYCLLIIISRINAIRFPDYTVFWKIYKSTKNLN